jgi:hypothetical protein
VEQLEVAMSGKALKVVIDKTKPEWLEEAQAELDAVKPGFFDELHAFLGRFEEWKLTARSEFEIIRGNLLDKLGQVRRVETPLARPLDFGDVDSILTIVKRKDDPSSS